MRLFTSTPVELDWACSVTRSERTRCHGLTLLEIFQTLGRFIPGFEVMHERFLLGQITEAEETLANGSDRGYRFAADLALNASHLDTRGNMIKYWEVDMNDPEKVTR